MPAPPLERRIKDFIVRLGLVKPGERLLVAVSGGPDSVCLLKALFDLRRELEIELHVAHLNHQLRGEASDGDAAYVLELARSLGLPATVEKRDVMAYKREHRLSLEEAAREVRYTFLAEAAEQTGAPRTATGHTLDDNIETILLHLVRGTGTRGLRGLLPETVLRYSGNAIRVVRPLLEVTRSETAAYCASHALNPRFDVSNLSLSPLRNRIRRQLLPLLRSYNPRIVKTLQRTASLAADELDFMAQAAARLWSRVASEKDESISFERKGMLELPPALQRQILLTAMGKLLGSTRDIEMRHIEDMVNALQKPAGKRLMLPGGLIFIVDYDKYVLCPDTTLLAPFPPLEGERAIIIPGTTHLPGWLIESDFIEPALTSGEPDIFTAHLAADIAGNKITLRPRRQGDRFQPLGMSEPKKLGEFMIDAKIPRSWRDSVPILSSPVQILWVVGWRIDERAKVRGTTRRVLRIRFKREPAAG